MPYPLLEKITILTILIGELLCDGEVKRKKRILGIGLLVSSPYMASLARLVLETSYLYILWRKRRVRLAVPVHFHVHVALQLIFTFLAASIFHFLNTAITFSCFLPTKFVSSGFYLPLFGLSLLSTSLKTLKFSRKKNLALLLLLFVCLFFFSRTLKVWVAVTWLPIIFGIYRFPCFHFLW